jgi:hypothetical protein
MLLDIDDIDNIDDSIQVYAEPCREYVTELKRRNESVGEKFLQSAAHLQNLMSRSNLKMKQRETIALLVDIMLANEQ